MKNAAPGLHKGLNGKAGTLENCKMCMQNKKEGQRGCFIYQSFCWIRLTKYSVNMKNGSLHYLIASCPYVFHSQMCLCVIDLPL